MMRRTDSCTIPPLPRVKQPLVKSTKATTTFPAEVFIMSVKEKCPQDSHSREEILQVSHA